MTLEEFSIKRWLLVPVFFFYTFTSAARLPSI